MRRLQMLFIILAVLLSGFTYCYGADSLTFRNGRISATFSDNWKVSDKIQRNKTGKPDAHTLVSGYHVIFRANKLIDGQKTSLKLQYIYSPDRYDKDRAAVSPLTKKELTTFHSKYVKRLTDDLFTRTGNVIYTNSNRKIGRSDFGYYIKMPLQVDSENKVLYYIPKGGAVAAFIVTSENGKLNKAQISDVEGIIKSYHDNGYYAALGGGMIPPVQVNSDILEANLAADKKAKTDSYLKIGRIAGSLLFALSMFKLKRKKTSARKAKMMQQSDEKPVIIPTKRPGSDKKYQQNLEEMLKNGLLTKKQYNEIMKKYK